MSRGDGRALCALLGLALLSSPAGAGAAQGHFAPTAHRSYTARLVAPAIARAQPRPRSAQRMALSGQTSWAGAPMRLLVLGEHYDATGRRWLRVRLPIRPNNASGWVDADKVRLSLNPWRVVVSTRSRTVRVYRWGKLARHFGAVVGKPGTPTPLGHFAIYETARQPDPGGFLGPWALHLTAHSNVLENFGGGPGRVAIHGRSGASLADPLGTARSHGCVRVDNRDVLWLARRAKPGTPVVIR